MASSKMMSGSGFRILLRTVTIAASVVGGLVMALTLPTHAQTFTVIHYFTGGGDGANPESGLAMDRNGNLYGTTAGGAMGCGTVFKLAHRDSGWILNPLYSFRGSSDGCSPSTRVVIGADGSLYGTTSAGGGSGCGGLGCGTVFNLRIPATICTSALCPWRETVLYRFTGVADGATPLGDLTLDQSGNIYGTTFSGGHTNSCTLGNPPGCGVVYKLTHSGGGWSQSVLYSFGGGTDGYNPQGGVVFDSLGNLYGSNSGNVIYGLMSSQSGWTFNVLHTLQVFAEGGDPIGELIFDPSGNLFGTTCCNGPAGDGGVYELTPSNGTWIFTLLYAYGGGLGATAGVTMDQSGNLYGTFSSDTVFELRHGNWQYDLLHEFIGSDGSYPLAPVILDDNGHVYGTAYSGGNGCAPDGCGVVFEIALNGNPS